MLQNGPDDLVVEKGNTPAETVSDDQRWDATASNGTQVSDSRLTVFCAPDLPPCAKKRRIGAGGSGVNWLLCRYMKVR